MASVMASHRRHRQAGLKAARAALVGGAADFGFASQRRAGVVRNIRIRHFHTPMAQRHHGHGLGMRIRAS